VYDIRDPSRGAREESGNLLLAADVAARDALAGRKVGADHLGAGVAKRSGDGCSNTARRTGDERAPPAQQLADAAERVSRRGLGHLSVTAPFSRKRLAKRNGESWRGREHEH
jgi:hypothetical protein